MSNKLSKGKAELSRDRYCNVSIIVCFAGIIGIAVSSSIPMTLGILAIAGGAIVAMDKKVQKINEE